MKEILIFLFGMLYMIDVNAQVIVDGTDINRLDIRYIQVSIAPNAINKNVRVEIDFGQERAGQNPGVFTSKISNAQGETLRFSSVMEVINFLDKNDWEVEDFSTNLEFNSVENKVVYFYLMRRKGK